MRLTLFEWKKLLSGNMKGILLFLFLVNAVVFYVYLIPVIPTQQQADMRQKLEKQIENRGQDLESDLQYLEAQVNGLGRLLTYREVPEVFSEEEIRQILDEYQDTPYLDMEKEKLQEESQALYGILEKYKAAVDYRSFIEGLKSRADQMLLVPVFAENVFSVRNIEKTAKDFAAAEQILVTPVDGMGLSRLQTFYLTDILVLVIVCLLCFQEFGYDSKSGMRNLIQATPKGGGWLRLAQMQSIWLAAVLLALVLYGSNLIQTGIFVGFDSLEAYVQGISEFRNVSFPCTVGWYLVLFLLGKVLAVLFLTVVCQFLAVKFNGEKIAWVLFGGGVAVSFLLWFLIPDSPAAKTFRYLNLVGILDMRQILGNYQNLSFFSYPVSLLWAAIIFSAVLAGILILGILTVHGVNFHLPRFELHRKKREKSRTGKGGAFAYECSKLFINQKVWVLVLLLVIYVLSGLNLDTEYITGEDYYYEKYVQQYQGEYTSQKAQEIFELYENRYALDEKAVPAVERLYEQTELLSGQENGQPGIVNLRKLGSFFGDEQTEIKNLLILVLVLALSFSSLYDQDKKKDMDQLFRSMPLGNKVYWGKIKLALLSGALYAAVIWSIPYFEYFMRYGMADGQYSVQSVPELVSVPGEITIASYMMLTIFMRIVIGAYLGVVLAFVAQLFANPVQNLVCSILTLVLPLCMSYVGNMGYNNVLVNFINQNLSFAMRHVKILGGLQRACIGFGVGSWLIFLLIPIAMLYLGERMWNRK